jgi:hypothetical protein
LGDISGGSFDFKQAGEIGGAVRESVPKKIFKMVKRYVSDPHHWT